MPAEQLVTINEDYLRRAKSSFEVGTYSDVFASRPNYALRDSCIVVKKP